MTEFLFMLILLVLATALMIFLNVRKYRRKAAEQENLLGKKFKGLGEVY